MTPAYGHELLLERIAINEGARPIIGCAARRWTELGLGALTSADAPGSYDAPGTFSQVVAWDSWNHCRLIYRRSAAPSA